uniref:Uncharacterized protein n=1 Tax=Moniliophthora roreri TaxID=221103 RepID=A0A0W0F4N9_MONRR
MDSPCVYESQTYARLLFPLRHGYALWIPEPNELLPLQYRETGVRIGDVGLITEDGGFDYIFNICASADDPINQMNGVPDDFEQLRWNASQAFQVSDRFRAGVPICSSGATQWEIGAEGVVAVPGFPIGVGGGIGVRFSREQGAVLMPTTGAHRIDCRDRDAFLRYAGKHGVRWYQFVNGKLSRGAENGSLYLITGMDKSASWETALVNNTSKSQSCSLVFMTGGLGGEGRLKLSRSSVLQASVTSRCSTNSLGLENQTLFVRGFRLSVRDTTRRLFMKTSSPRIRVDSTYNASSKDIFSEKGGGVPYGRSSTSSSGSSTRVSRNSSEGSSDNDVQSENHRDRNGLSEKANDVGAQEALPWLQRPESTLVVTHDDDWMSILTDEDTDIPDESNLLQRILNEFESFPSGGQLLGLYFAANHLPICRVYDAETTIWTSFWSSYQITWTRVFFFAAGGQIQYGIVHSVHMGIDENKLVIVKTDSGSMVTLPFAALTGVS